MTPNDIYYKFLSVYPIMTDEIVKFIMFDRNVMWVKLKNRKELVFTYFSSNKWKIESMDLYKKDEK